MTPPEVEGLDNSGPASSDEGGEDREEAESEPSSREVEGRVWTAFLGAYDAFLGELLALPFEESEVSEDDALDGDGDLLRWTVGLARFCTAGFETVLTTTVVFCGV